MTLEELKSRRQELQKAERVKLAEYNQIVGMIAENARMIAALESSDKAEENEPE